MNTAPKTSKIHIIETTAHQYHITHDDLPKNYLTKIASIAHDFDIRINPNPKNIKEKTQNERNKNFITNELIAEYNLSLPAAETEKPVRETFEEITERISSITLEQKEILDSFFDNID